jgi:DNA polymerase elongation subunit (family B)
MEKHYRKKLDLSKEKVKQLCFQALEWQDFNEPECIEDDDMEIDFEDSFNYSENKELDKYLIRIFGVNSNGNSVCLNVKNFTPFFFVKVADNYTREKVKVLVNTLKKALKNTKTKQDDIWKTLDYSGCLLDDKCIIQNKHDFYGFSNKKLFRFVRLTFSNNDAMRKCINLIKYSNSGKKNLGLAKLPLYEANLDSIIRFAHIKNLKFCGWIKASNVEFIAEEFSSSHCQIEASVDWQNVELEDNANNAPILQASYDIETYSIDGSFPSPEIKGNVITQIATSFKYFGSSDFLVKHIICLKNCSPLYPGEDNVAVFLECYDTEEEVLIAWKKVILNMDPDILYQYNGDQFDGNYLYKRALMNNCEESFLFLGKVKNKMSVLVENNFSSSAYGSSNFKRLSMPGRINFDILVYIKREYKENSYKLDYVSEKYLGQNKNPVTAQMMFKYFEEGDPDKIREVAYYCLQDTMLPQRLVDKLHILQNQLSMSNVTCVPIRFLIERGQQIKVFSQILKETRKQNFLVPTIENAYDKKKESSDSEDEEDSFTGATVLPPLKGAYFEPITVCDFASLYPSIMRAHNLCFSTIILDSSFDNLNGVDYKTVEWTDTINEKEIKHSYRYVQNTEGILPKLLAELTLARKEYKKLMKDTSDPFLSEVYNKCQNAVKVSMNSMYGFLAAPMLCCKPIAATVTSIGRDMIEDTKKFMETNYNASVAVYGDSVTGDTPILLRHSKTKEVIIKTIESLGENNWTSYQEFKSEEITNRKEKMQTSCQEYQVWTDIGWSKINKVIKHSTNKKIYRVSTLYGSVDVTEDHSLLDETNCIVKPGSISKETKLLHSYPIENMDDGLFMKLDFDLERAFLMGIADGKGGISEHARLNFVMNSGSIDTMKHYIAGFASYYPYVTRDKLGRIESFSFANKLLCSKFFYILEYYNLDNVTLTVLDDTHYRYRVTIIFHENPQNNCKKVISCTEIKPGGEFRQVYDIETEIGKFQAGIGKIIVKNTDSVFIKFKTETSENYKKSFEEYQRNPLPVNKEIYEKLKVECIQESINIGKIAAKNATKNLFINPINLEYEKVYCPLLLLSKKRYIGVLYSENPKKSDYSDNKGVVLKRRDNFQLLKTIYSKVISILLEKGNYGAEEAKNYIEEMLYKIVNNEFENLDDFVISKLLKNTYKSKNIPHLVLARKMRLRDPGSAPNSNDRVPYVFTYPDASSEVGKKLIKFIQEERNKDFIEKVTIRSGKKMKTLEEAIVINKTLAPKIVLKKNNKYSQYEKVEDPNYMIEHKLPLDAEYYITFMKTSVCEILNLFMDNSEKIFDDIIKEFKESMW